MGERVRGERHYDNRDYENSPYAAPLALRAIRASVVRRRNPVALAADGVIERINNQLDGPGRAKSAPTPPAEGIDVPHEEALEEDIQPLPRRKLGGAALAASSGEAA